MSYRRPIGWATVLVALTVLAAVAPSPASAQAPRPSRVTVVPISTGTTETLTAVSFPDAMHGFAVGAGGTIVASSDGGATWVRQVSGIEHLAPPTDSGPVQNNLVDVSFTDALHGHAVGDDHVLVTADGGRSWQLQTLPSVDSVPGEGPGRSTDPTRPPTWSFKGVSFTDADHGVLVGPGGTVFSTADGGRTWLWHGERRFGLLRDVSFSDPDHGHAVASLPEPNQLFVSVVTSDGGRTWQPRKGEISGVMNSNLKAVASVDRERTYVAGGGGRILVTTDDGQHWVAQRRETTETFYGLAFSGRGRGVAAGLTEFTGRVQASLATTDDGGETWASRLVTGDILWDVAFADPATAYAVGCAGYNLTATADAPVTGCKQSLLLKLSFEGTPRAGGATGGGGLSPGGPGTGRWLLGGGVAALLAVLGAAVVMARRRRGPSS